MIIDKVCKKLFRLTMKKQFFCKCEETNKFMVVLYTIYAREKMFNNLDTSVVHKTTKILWNFLGNPKDKIVTFKIL